MGEAARYELQASTDGVEGLTFDRRARLPPVCIKCGTDELVKYRHDRLEHRPLWAALFRWWLFGSRVSEVRIPLCARCNQLWWRAGVVPLVAMILAYVALFGGFSVWLQHAAADAAAASALRASYPRYFAALLVGWLALRTAGILALRAAARRWRLRVVRQDGELITVEAVHARAREAAPVDGLPKPRKSGPAVRGSGAPAG
jgi:hypothetical protein